MAAIQDVVAIGVAAAAAAWLARGFLSRFSRPGCGGSAPPASRRLDGGPDGFVPIDRLNPPEKRREKTWTDP